MDSSDGDDVESRPARPITVKADIGVAGHTVSIEVTAAMEPTEAIETITARALSMLAETAGYAARSPIGFAAGMAQVERSEYA